jgi:hypothetical protein
MNYRDGQAVQLGDKVRLGDDQSGVVVAVIEAGEYGSIWATASSSAQILEMSASMNPMRTWRSLTGWNTA